MNRSGLEFTAPPRLRRLAALAFALGSAVLLAGVWVVPDRAWGDLLVAAVVLLGLGLGGIFFVSLQYVSGAGWSVALRRVPEAMAAALPAGALALAAVLLFRPSLYGWFHPMPGGEAFPPFKQFWLSRPFFLLRSAIYLFSWILFTAAIVRSSRRQDEDGDVAHTYRNVRLSAGFVVVFAITVWLASYDWIMSLEPRWYSTIFGIYSFAGLFLSTLAALIVLVVGLNALGPLRGILTPSHLHDLGKLLFAFSTFWMYIWFSQYMLIWYANIPEETAYFVKRLRGAWEPLFILNMLLNWGIPFGVLLHRGAKRSPYVLLRVAAVILAGRWLDVYLMIFPALGFGQPVFGIWELATLLAAAGLFTLLFFRAFSRARVIPVNDPYLVESLHAYQ